MKSLDQLSELEAAALDAWKDVSGRAGLPRDGWSFTRLSKREDAEIARISHRVAHPDHDALTYKFQLRPVAAEGFAAEYHMQAKAHEAFPHSAELTLPRPVYLDADHQASLMTYMTGRPLSEYMRDACFDRVEQLRLLVLAGRWLDAYHRAGAPQEIAFQPAHTVAYYTGLRERILAGELRVAAKPLFLQGIDKIVSMAPEVAGQKTVTAAQHGDFHMRNLIFDGQRMAGIDISKDQHAPVGYDIAKILLDYTSILRGETDLRPGQVIPDDAMAAFFDGYRLVGPDDPGVAFLLFARILATLVHVPQKQKDRTDAKQRTLARLRPIAQNAYSSAAPGEAARAKPGIRLYLTSDSLKRARDGSHEICNAMREVGRRTGRDIVLSRNAPRHRQAADSTQMSLVHMAAPIGQNGLVYRRLYAGHFWRIERIAERWLWETARAEFVPDAIDTKPAAQFFDSWQHRLYGAGAGQATRQGFIYMPLQGKLLTQRSFQSASPVEMIEQTLAHTDRPIVATLHPTESYSDEESAALAELERRHDRFRIEPLAMTCALTTCDLVVTENSSAAFHAMFFGKPAVLFAGVDFHHICASVPDLGVAGAFDKAAQMRPDFAKYLYWFWKMNAIDIEDEDHVDKLIARFRTLGWEL